ncbi:MAG: serine hydrolase domain-containing protein [Candidatus Binataceae bacterium]
MEDQVLKPLVPKLEGIVNRTLERERVPGAAIGIVRDQELVWSRGFGYADLARDRVPDADTLFRCGSITKTFTATAIMQLCDDGKLGIDDPIVRYIPEFSAVKTRFGTPGGVTIRRLLTHTSGLMGEGPNNGWEKLEFPPIEDMVAALGRTEIVIEPESQYKYSNLGFALLGEVIRRISGQQYADYMQRNLLEPLGMNGSGLSLTDSMRPRMATGYTIRTVEGEPQIAPHFMLHGWDAAGSLYSSVNDLARWISFQFRTKEAARGGSQVLNGRTLSAMHRVQFMESNLMAGYALGWRVDRRGENVYHHHSGGIHGFLTKITFNKLRRVGAIVLTNGNPHMAFETIGYELLEAVIPAIREATDAAQSPGKPVPTPEKYRLFVGRYEDPQMGGVIWIVSRSGELVILNPGSATIPPGPDQRLVPSEDPLVFTVHGGRPAGEPMVFRVAEDGTVVGFLMSHAWAFRKVGPINE